MSTVLGIGLATLDLISVVDGYPAENSKVRALERRRARGGNAATTLAVLSQLGHFCRLAALVGGDDEGRFILDDLRAQGIDTSACRVLPGQPSLLSYVVVNRRNGSRTVVHHRAIPELGGDDVATLSLDGVDWLHVEGRDLEETRRMLDRSGEERPDLPRSLELERAREGWQELVARAEVVIASRSFAEELEAGSATELLDGLRRLAPRASLVCPWGGEGAFASSPAGPVFRSPASPPRELVDTLGAGDTFNAGLIDALLRGEGLVEAVGFANRLAGRKCGQHGIAGLGDAVRRR